MNLSAALGLSEAGEAVQLDETQLALFINLKLAARGHPVAEKVEEEFPSPVLSRSLLATLREKNRLLRDYLCPADRHIQEFLDAYLEGVGPEGKRWIPDNAMPLEHHGMARVLSLPAKGDHFHSSIIDSYRVHQGVLHNPAKDRRTTQGVFHIAEGGLPIPHDKKAVPRPAFAALLERALEPPPELLRLPFSDGSEHPAELFVSLLLRPVVCPEVAGVSEGKTMEVRFFAPASLVSNLDFVESIFGNAGDPYLPENDARLDTDHWSGHTGCVILAPHLVSVTKKELGLPRKADATPRQVRDGMCWEREDELYNEGGAFKVTCRDERGVVVTLIADNYFGYCKKEVKTQLSYAANLMGNAEEEHAGGALVFPAYDLGEDFSLSTYVPTVDHTFAEMLECNADRLEVQPGGYAVDKTYPDIIYVPEDVRITLHDQKVAWGSGEGSGSLRLAAGHTYVLPSGYKVEMIQPSDGRRWRLIGTTAEGLLCHKPCTVSGGGKSEISKSLADAMVTGPVVTMDFQRDFELVAEIVGREFGDRFRDRRLNRSEGRPLLSEDRSLGSVVKLMTPSPEYSDAYNDWLESLPGHVVDLVLLVKRFYKPDWGEDWAKRFSVDRINGRPGNTLKYRNHPLYTQYLRVGYDADGSWRTFSVRKDFHPAVKLQQEDDITASVVAPASLVEGLRSPQPSRGPVKFVHNCEFRLFQRPDDAVIRGYDRHTEGDFSRPGNFFSNYHPVSRDEAAEIAADVIRFSQYTEPMQAAIRDFLAAPGPDYLVVPSHPRVVEGRPTKNPRYLQVRPDLVEARKRYLCRLGARLYRRLKPEQEPLFPVGSVLPGRRNNPPDKAAGIRALAVYGPIHHQELPELFADFVASLTGRSPSTTGAGSEGALTKGPFNALLPITDLNNALVAYLLTGHAPFTTAAGHIGPKYRVDHDISLLVPEIWCRMYPEERDPAFLIKEEFLEPCRDFEYEGRTVLASRLGWRINEKFVRIFGGRVFSRPQAVFPADFLRPELQDEESFADGVDNIVETQGRVASAYFEDGSVELACPPLNALLHLVAGRECAYRGFDDPGFRELFQREHFLAQDWYRERLEAKQAVDRRGCERLAGYLRDFIADPANAGLAERMDLRRRLGRLERLARAEAADLTGFLGADPGLLPRS
ncbi:MAG: hypothetical protein EA425_12690 [Puniceicoccaceae bacterium]|nr:MAG: hypothetical protein EA425_12690 [Puniceicoccaceae bacterium]